jgi:hypothetical protein
MTDLVDYVRARHPDAPWESGILATKKKSPATTEEHATDADGSGHERKSINARISDAAEDEEDAPASRFPKHWGPEPSKQTRDHRQLPRGYGNGSSTLAKWIQSKLDKDDDESESPASAPPGEDL